MYEYRFKNQNGLWEYFQAKEARQALKIVCKKGFNPSDVVLQTTIEGTREWVNCSHQQDDRSPVPVIGPDGTVYESMTEAASQAGCSVKTMSRWAAKAKHGWQIQPSVQEACAS